MSAIDAGTGQITILLPRVPQPQTVVIRLTPDASQRRYPSDSARFCDAVPSTLSEIKIGDQIHALGERSADGLSFTAEIVVSGSFRNFAAVVSSVDVSRGALRVNDLERNKTVTLQIGKDAAMRRITPDVAQALVIGNSAAARQRRADNGALDIREIIERLPEFHLRELKPGDALVVASLEPVEETARGTVTAFALLAGAEPLLKQPAGVQRTLLGSWNLSLDPGQP